MTSLQKIVLNESRFALHNLRAHVQREQRLKKSYGSLWIDIPCAKCDRTARRVIRAALLCEKVFA